jgi:16S rRNA (adenine1518-N6/adenine1519-N6)-dimethyltransferase
MTLSEINSLLNALGASPTKSLGQNFLHDQNLARAIVDLAGIESGEPWIEIGPGLGALTDFATQRSTRGTLIEKDDRLIGHLALRFPELEVIHGDASAFDVRHLLPEGPLTVLGNLPYYVSSQIIFNFANPILPVKRMIFTLQRELADRLCAGPGTRDFGGPSVILGRSWIIRLERTLPPSVFLPQPHVDSAVVSFSPRPPESLPACDPDRFSRIVKLGYSQRRKQLGKLLSLSFSDWSAAIAHADVSRTARAEELTIAQWCLLAQCPAPSETGATSTLPNAHSAAGAQDVHGEQFDVVDESDQPVSVLSRFEVHRQKLRHRAVHIFIFNAKGELFLQKRSRWKDVHPSCWDSSAAGHVNAGQTYAETAPRELEEEMGVQAPLEEIGAVAACPMTGMEFVRIFRGVHEGPFVLPPAEIECGAFFPPSLIDRWIARRPSDFASGFIACWEATRARRQHPPA